MYGTYVRTQDLKYDSSGIRVLVSYVCLPTSTYEYVMLLSILAGERQFHFLCMHARTHVRTVWEMHNEGNKL